MARLTAEQYAAQLRYLRYQDGLRLPNSGLGERDQFALDAHERAEAAEKECVSLLDQLQHSAIAEAELAIERDDLRQRLAAAEALVEKTQSEDGKQLENARYRLAEMRAVVDALGPKHTYEDCALAVNAIHRLTRSVVPLEEPVT